MYAQDNKQFLLFLLATVPTQAKVLLKHLTRGQYMALKEVCVNLLRGSFKVTSEDLVKLRKYKAFFRQLASGKKVRLLQKPLILLLQVAKSTLEAL